MTIGSEAIGNFPISAESESEEIVLELTSVEGLEGIPNHTFGIISFALFGFEFTIRKLDRTWSAPKDSVPLVGAGFGGPGIEGGGFGSGASPGQGRTFHASGDSGTANSGALSSAFPPTIVEEGPSCIQVFDNTEWTADSPAANVVEWSGTYWTMPSLSNLDVHYLEMFTPTSADTIEVTVERVGPGDANMDITVDLITTEGSETGVDTLSFNIGATRTFIFDLSGGIVTVTGMDIFGDGSDAGEVRITDIQFCTEEV